MHEKVFWTANDKLYVDDISLPMLPDWYKRQAFANDVLSLFNDGKPIGGHCVIPNLDLLPASAGEIKKFVERYG